MKLAYFARTAGAKGETNRLRREGCIPAIIYNQGQSGDPVYIKKADLDVILRKMQPGLLSTTFFELSDGVKTVKVLIKEVQYHRTSYAIEHLDFIAVSDEKPVQVNVPIQLSGVADCVGVKLGGFLRPVIRSLKVSCLPKHLPQNFVLDVKDLGLTESRRLADIPIPEGVRPIGKMNEIAVVIAKKA
jgi:large subunit ribosomal protein L25